MPGLLEKLKQFGIEHEKEVETNLWSAWALLDSDGKHPVSELIADIVARTDASTESLRAAVELAVRESDFLQAAKIQRRIALMQTLEPDQQFLDQLKLGQWLWLSGDKEAAASEWKSVSRRGGNESLVAAFAREMIDKGNWSIAASLIDVGVESSPQAWDLLTLGIFANIQVNNPGRAADLSEQLLALKLSPRHFDQRGN